MDEEIQIDIDARSIDRSTGGFCLLLSRSSSLVDVDADVDADVDVDVD